MCTKKKKKVVLFGGSFNPAHIGHMRMARSLHQFSGCDEVWMMFAQNDFKDPKAYASLEDRLAMADLLLNHIPDTPVHFNTLQEEMQTHQTVNVLKELSKRYPDHEFVWSMGTDSLIRFHEWGDYDYIIDNYAMILVDRPTYTADALKSKTARDYKHLMGDTIHLMSDPEIGDLSSTTFRDALKQTPHADFGPMDRVADYAAKKGLYGAKKHHRETKTPRRPRTKARYK